MVRPTKHFFEMEEQRKHYKRQYQQDYRKHHMQQKADAQSDQFESQGNGIELEQHGKHRPNVTIEQLQSERIQENNIDNLHINTNRCTHLRTSEEAHAQQEIRGGKNVVIHPIHNESLNSVGNIQNNAHLQETQEITHQENIAMNVHNQDYERNIHQGIFEEAQEQQLIREQNNVGIHLVHIECQYGVGEVHNNL